MEQSKPKNEAPQSAWVPVYSRTLDDGTVLIVERALSYTSEAHRFTVQLTHGSVFGSQRDFLSTLYRTFSDIAEQRTSSEPASPSGKPPTPLE